MNWQSRTASSIDPIADHEFSPGAALDASPCRPVLVVPDLTNARSIAVSAFRKETLTSIGRGYSRVALEPASPISRPHTEIREVILTAATRLSLATRALARNPRRIEAIPHVRLLRIHTRVPVALPSRITSGLVEALQDG